MTRHRDAADTRRRERRRAAHPVQVTAGAGVVEVEIERAGGSAAEERQRVLAHIRSVCGVGDDAAPRTRRRWGEELLAEIERGDHVARYASPEATSRVVPQARLTPTEARALAGVLEAVAADVELAAWARAALDDAAKSQR